MRLTIRDNKQQVGNYVSPSFNMYLDVSQAFHHIPLCPLVLTCQIAEYIARRVSLFKPSAEKTHFVLGLPTGSSPLPVYQRLVELYKKGEVSFKVSPQASTRQESS